MQFSTLDQDNDEWGRSCADTFTGAFWYRTCLAANLFGQYVDNCTCHALAECIAWLHWPKQIGSPDNYWYSFKEVKIKMEKKGKNY